MSSGPKLDSASLRATSHIFSASANCPLPYDSAPAAMYFSHSESWAPTRAGERARQRRATASRVIGTRGEGPAVATRWRAAARCGGRGRRPAGGAMVTQGEGRPWPLGGEQPPGAGGRDVRGAELAASEADIGGERVPGRHLLDHLAAGRDHRDGAGHERRDADGAGAVDGERVEELEAREPGQERAAGGAEAGAGHDLARPGELPVPDAPGPRLGDVEPAPVGGEADAVRRIEREDRLADERAVGARVEDARPVAVALAHLAVVGEPEAAGRVEDDVVRP